MNKVVPMIFYFLEIKKYCMGNNIFFEGKNEHLRSIIWIGMLYLSVVIFWKEDVILLYLLSYLFAAVTSVHVITGSVYTKLWHTICILGITTCIEQILGVVLNVWVNQIILKSCLEMVFSIMILMVIERIKVLIPKTKYIGKEMLTSALLSVMLVLICFMIEISIGVFEEAYKYVPKRIGSLYFDIMFGFAYVSILFLIFVVLHIRNLHVKLEEKVQAEQELKLMQKKYFEALLEKEQNTRQYRHDIDNHFLCIREIAQKEKAKQTMKYIQDLQQKLFTNKKKIYYTGMEIFDILLNNYLENLKCTEIKVKGNAISKLKISDVDFCIIFSNLLKNAVEEIERQDENGTNLEIEIEQGKFYTRIRISNSSNFMWTHNTKLPLTRKDDKINHGLGLKNVMETIERNDGQLEFSTDEKMFTVVVILKNDR